MRISDWSSDVCSSDLDRRGISIDDLEWYIVFADFKIAVILEQIHARHVAGTTVGGWFDDIGGMVGPLLNRSHERAVRRSEEHTSDLQSLMRTSYAVFCLHKKNKNRQQTHKRKR